ncbi:hypothetical protein CUMW_246130 [Citrus unshiu]|uniref:Uncharacterized protein n=1 Tax=Citrus unshiu TaxID=55188 RepID=A0A2H5QNC0_CITUN|nr:hypothetical protein CUMW_246130 [Citrus unshiu]
MGGSSHEKKLEFLSLGDASNLKRIYRDPLPFPQLEEIYISRCPKLQKLPLNSSSAKGPKYIWGLRRNLDDLQTQKENLIAKKQDLLNKVKLAEQQSRTRRTTTVELWFRRAEEIETKVENLQKEGDQQVDRLCLGGFCSKDLISSYDFGKKVENLKEKVIELKKEGDAMKEVYEGVPEGAAVEKAVDRTIVGQESILDRVWRGITDQEKNEEIIGLYGMGGIGKTTLLKQVNNKFCSEEHDFDVVIWSVVSREPNLRQIQEDIGKRIGFSTDSWQRKRILSLVSLNHLDLSWTGISGLPQELKALVLRMLRCGPSHPPIVVEGNVLSADAESLMKEIHCLEQLNLITLSLHGSRGVENFLKFPKLQNITQALSIENCNSLPLNLLHLANMEHLEQLSIWDSNLEDWNVDCAGEVQKMRKLHFVTIYECSNVKDLTWLVFVPNLKRLRIFDCDDMEEIISVENFEKLSEVSEMMGELNLFSELESLSLGYASNLKRIYHDPLPFPQLEEIRISECPKLKKLPLNSSSAKGPPKIEEWEEVKRISLMDNNITTKYIWGLKGNLDDLQTQKENLTAKKQDLLNKVKLAEQQSRTRRTTTVELWFRRVEEIETRVENLQKEGDQQVDRLCLGGFCSTDLISSYDFGKKVENLREKVIELKKEGEAMKEVYEGVPEGAAVAIAVDRTIVGQESILDQVWRCITDQKKNEGIIGLYGMGGVGKTTLLNQDLTWLVFVPNLKWLRIVGCDDLEEIISVENFEKLSEVSEMMGELNLFTELESLILRNASNLKRIYRDPLPFPRLKEILILKCPKLKKLPLNSSSAKGRKIVIYGEKEWWEELQWEDQATQNAFSPCLAVSCLHE